MGFLGRETAGRPGADPLKNPARLAREGIRGDLAANLVQLQVDQHAVSASVAAVRSADEVIGSLLDALA